DLGCHRSGKDSPRISSGSQAHILLAKIGVSRPVRQERLERLRQLLDIRAPGDLGRTGIAYGPYAAVARIHRPEWRRLEDVLTRAEGSRYPVHSGLVLDLPWQARCRRHIGQAITQDRRAARDPGLISDAPIEHAEQPGAVLDADRRGNEQPSSCPGARPF